MKVLLKDHKLPNQEEEKEKEKVAKTKAKL